MKRCRRVFETSGLRQSVSLLCTVTLLATFIGYHPLTIANPSVAVRLQATGSKRALTHQDYDSWRSIQGAQISRDGRFVAYAFMPQDGDGEVVARNVSSGAEWRAPRGYHPPVPPPDDPGANVAEFQAAQARLVRPLFTADGRFVVFSTEPTKAELNRAKKEKKKPEEMPKNGIGIMDLSNGTVTRVEKVRISRSPKTVQDLLRTCWNRNRKRKGRRTKEATRPCARARPRPNPIRQ